MLAKGANGVEPGSIPSKRRGRKLDRQRPFLDAVDLEDEEDGIRTDIGDALLDRLIELRDGRIRHVAGIDELGIAADRAQKSGQWREILQSFIAADGFCQRLAG